MVGTRPRCAASIKAVCPRAPRWSTDALDYIFANPIFRNNRFKRNAGIPPPVANSFTNKLVEAGLLRVLIPPAGRSPGMYAFTSLLEIVAEP